MKRTDGAHGLAMSVGAIAAAAVVAGCGGAGVNVQKAPPATSSSAPTADTAASATATAATTGFGSDQPAVDTVVAMLAAYNTAVRSPRTASTAGFDKYLVGPAKATVDATFASAKADGIAARGTPNALRISIISTSTASGTNFVDLVDCPLVSATHPASSYYVKTGKPFVVTPDPNEAPQPWPETFKLTQANGVGRWVITQTQTDMSKTCDQ